MILFDKLKGKFNSLGKWKWFILVPISIILLLGFIVYGFQMLWAIVGLVLLAYLGRKIIYYVFQFSYVVGVVILKIIAGVIAIGIIFLILSKIPM